MLNVDIVLTTIVDVVLCLDGLDAMREFPSNTHSLTHVSERGKAPHTQIGWDCQK